MSLCHAYRVRKMRNKGRSRRLAAAANSADAASAEATSPTSPSAGADDDEVRRPFAASDRVGSRAGSGAGTGPSDADTTSGDVRLNMFASSEHVGWEGDEGFRGDGATTPVEARGVETLAMLDEQQLWAMGLLGDEQIETKNLSREGSAHSEIGYEPAAWVDSETCQLVPELRNELLELMHQKRARSTEPEDVDDYLVL